MYSRRNLRIKVMQALYAYNQNPDAGSQPQKKWLENSVNLTQKLYLFNLHYLLSVVGYSQEDVEVQKQKMLKKNVESISTLIYDNEIVKNILNDYEYQSYLKEKKPFLQVDNDRVKSDYQELRGSDAYKTFLELENAGKADEVAVSKILLHLYSKIIYGSELFQSNMEELFPVWIDERTYILKLVENKLKSSDKSSSESDLKEAHDFTGQLFSVVIDTEKELMDHISPKLKNWDVDRMSQVDVILLKMCLAELLYFPDIPIKVSLNEYIDIAKVYSGPKSKDFINGVIDKVKNDLLSKNKIKKAGRGLMND